MEIDLKYLPNILKISPELCGFCGEDQTRSFAFFSYCFMLFNYFFLKKKKIAILGFVWMRCPKFTTTTLRNGTLLLAARWVTWDEWKTKQYQIFSNKWKSLWKRPSKPSTERKLLTQKVPTQKTMYHREGTEAILNNPPHRTSTE